MADVITRSCKQWLTYWKRSETTDKFGKFSFDAPVEIKARFTEDTFLAVSRRDSNSAIQDTPKQSDMSYVYVLQDVRIGDWMYLGRIADLGVTPPADPKGLKGATEVKRFSKLPNFRNTNFLRKAYL